MVTWRELIDEATEALAGANVAEPALSARRIGQQATGSEGAEWLETLEQHATRRQVASFDSMLTRRRGGEPLQYVIGRWGFRHLDLFIDRRVLIPRPETEVVAGAALDEVTRLAGTGAGPITVVDLGTGSGAIGLSLAQEHEAADVWLTDISADALAVARANVAGLGRAGSRVRIVHGDWFAALPGELSGTVGVVVSNPPYVARHDEVDPQVSWEPDDALFAPDSADGVAAGEHLEHLIDFSPVWLADDGALVVEMAPHQVEVMAARAAQRFAQVDTVVDLAQRLRAIVARFPSRD
ncbi:MAG: peptide chain release factor N(5)-glutamine methyltransferase [Acidimicrobiia bacterium]|nr:peptide chain release factor N(5)-glutamine methyltransferase [Acidimicrobiia bacterium]